MHNKIEGISVIICCYNSEQRITKTLGYLFRQKFAEIINWEIIVVDNNSQDNTIKLAECKLTNFHGTNFSFQILKENKQGLNYARLKGIRSARYKYLLFCDDDNWLTENYISTGFDILNSNSGIGILGGVGIPFFDAVKPDWFDKYQLYFAVGKQFNITGDISNLKGWLYGAGLFLNKDALLDIDKHNFLTTDRKGKNLSSGGDVELCFYILMKGYKIWYSEELTFFHYMTTPRLSIDYLKRLMLAGAKNAYRLEGMYYKAIKPANYSRLKKSWIPRLLIDAPRIKDFTGDGYISRIFKLKLHLLRMQALTKLNFAYDKSFR